MKLWDAENGREIETLTKHMHVSRPSVRLSPDGKAVASAGGAVTYLTDIASGSTIQWGDWTSRIVRSGAIAFSPDGKSFVNGNAQNILTLWDTTDGREIWSSLEGIKYISSLAYSPVEKIIAVVYGNTVRLWDITSGREIRSIIVTDRFHSPTFVAFSPDGKTIATAVSVSPDTTVKLWDVATGQEVRTLSGHSRTPESASFSPDGKFIVSGSYDNTIKLWDVAAGQEIRTFSGHTESVSSVSFSPDGKHILSGSNDGTVKLWDVATGKETKTFSHPGMINKVTFSPDGKIIASSRYGSKGDDTVKLWDITSGREIRTFSYDYSVVGRDIVFSPDGKTFAYNIGRTVKLWDLINDKEIISLSGHSERVKTIIFSPDGKQIITSSDDGTVRLWDVSTGNEIAQFVSFSGNDSQLATATRGLTVETETATSAIDSEWISITPDGYYQASPRGDRYLNVRVNNTVSGIDSFRSVFYNPDVVQARLQGRPDPASKANVTIQQAANFRPPTVTIQSPANFSTTNTAMANLAVTVTDQNQPLKNIRVFVNGRSAAQSELAAVKGNGLQAECTALTVTGNQKTVSFTMPLELDPGNNRIEVVAFNGYSDTRRYVDVTWNAPAGQRPALPNLWILAVGVNQYDNVGTPSHWSPPPDRMGHLNYCVADAKGLIDSFKAQEGRRYAKVNTLLIADGEATTPTAENIRQNLKYLDQAGDRDVVLFFLAGHGISAQGGKFYFLPKDAALTGSTGNWNVDASHAISGDEMVAVLEGQGNRLLFIDACQSGGVDNDRMVRALQESNAFVFSASQGNELSYEDPRWGHGAFTYSILNALKGAPAAMAEGNVSVRSMSGFVSIEVPRLTDNRQNPKVHSLHYGDFPMAVIRQ